MRSNKLNKRTIILIVCAALLLAELIFVGVFHFSREDDETLSNMTEAPTEAVTEVPTEATEEMTEATEEPTEVTEATEISTEPTGEKDDNRYVLTFAGDCTLGSISANWNSSVHFVKTVGTNYDWPFANVAEYFEEDDFTMINLEGPLTDSSSGAAGKRFAFRGPTAYTEIMTGSSVEAVTLANNHSQDYGTAGYTSTKNALEGAGIAYVEENKTSIFTTESGLTIGLYADAFDFSASSIRTNISNLKNKGAEIIICAFHWGSEGHYRPSTSQQSFARAAIDAGADIVYGHHPHVLQKIEEYGDGIIYYSLGNFSFGGAANPQDYDSAFLQQEVIRNADGSVSLGELTIVPVSISSVSGRNNFQPKLLEEGTKAYDRVLSKLDGTFTGANLNIDYSKLDGDVPTEPEAPETEPETQPETQPGTKPDTQPETQPEATEKPSTGGSSSGGTTGGETSGTTGGGSTDTGNTGGGSTDTGSTGGGSTDTGNTGGGSTDTGSTGGGSTDTGSTGGGSTDTGSTSSGSTDTGSTSGGSTDTSSAGGGSTDTGSGVSADSGTGEV